MGKPPGRQKTESRSERKTQARACTGHSSGKAGLGRGNRLGLINMNTFGWSLVAWPEVIKPKEYCLLDGMGQIEEVRLWVISLHPKGSFPAEPLTSQGLASPGRSDLSPTRKAFKTSKYNTQKNLKSK